MNYMDKYNQWLDSKYIDEEIKEELKGINNNEKEIEDRFYTDLKFGTGGLRGKIGAGTNRINKYTVAKATQGLANYIINKGKHNRNKGVVIAYDSRYKSKEFATKAAEVLNGNGIKSYLFESLRPTPELSFAVRHLGAAAGIVITASHNPPEYNGYKVYGEDGGQIVPTIANDIIAEIEKIESFEEIRTLKEDEVISRGLLEIIEKEIDDEYVCRVKGLSVRSSIDRNIKIVYTPLHGTGNLLIRRVLEELGYNHVTVVDEQERPDPKFSTVEYPNPEDPKALKMALDLGRQIDADLVMGTDPDCDRVGIAVKNDIGEFVVLNGNQTGALLLDYILTSKKEKSQIPLNSVMVKTIVTSDLGRVIADSYNVETIDTLTGFKFIGEKIKEFEEKGNKDFIFGYEESFGYLAGTFVRDKDAVIASMLLAEMTAYYKKQGIGLYEALIRLYNKYGYYQEHLHSIKLEGIGGKKKIQEVIDTFKAKYPLQIEDLEVSVFNDYEESKRYDLNKNVKEVIDLPKSKVLKYIFNDNSWYALRPSGTEPKLKLYISANGKTKQEAQNKVTKIKDRILGAIEEII